MVFESVAVGPSDQDTQCKWSCDEMKAACRVTGKDAIEIFKMCNVAFAELSTEGIDAPDCGIAYIEETTGRKITHA